MSDITKIEWTDLLRTFTGPRKDLRLTSFANCRGLRGRS
jgi:hypothetical protein